jgi:hypothetical protein
MVIQECLEKQQVSHRAGWELRYRLPGPRQSRGKSGSAARCAESLWLSGADSLPSCPRLGWKAQPSSRVEGVGQGGDPRKGEEAVKILNLAFFALVFSVTYRREKLFFSIFSHLLRLSEGLRPD